MEKHEIKREDALYYLNELLDANGTEILSSLIRDEEGNNFDVIRNKDFRFSALASNLWDGEFSIILEDNNNARAFLFKDLYFLELNSHELLHINDKMRLLAKKEEREMTESFLAEIEIMKSR